ncbi:MAG: endonuclease MutS2 [Lachnospiraceae bacterium]|nr:endonuclease MutS2 [Lachnospiraceae bacterium]
MNKHVLKVVEFHKIRERLASLAGTREGNERLRSLVPMEELGEIEKALKQTEDAFSRLLSGKSLSFSGTAEVRPVIKRLSIESSLNPGELLMLGRMLENAQSAVSFGKGKEERDSLSDFFEALDPLPALCAELRRCILSPEEIADDASPRLSSLRRKLRGMDGRLHDKLTSLINHTETRKALQDPVITMRDGRYCLPVKAEQKSQVPGVVHDHSGSGSTLFIEPLPIVELNNELRELLLQEKDEIRIILDDLSSKLRVHSDILISDYDLLIDLDVIFARAKLAMEMNATRPILNEKGVFSLRKARHPLLPKETVVPVDLTLGKEIDMLILTGPNTGGKTVSLKTLGLLTVMALSGLMIPCLDRSEVAVVKEVFADIGDEQSIEQSLSTFSSHMKNIVGILAEADRSSLVLFDELCAGTDPTEGAALAVAILEDLRLRGVRTMATTHYSELKVYAMTRPFTSNASLEFDVETLSPTYRLMIGIPGKSNAFAISKKLGLPDRLIEDARKRLTENTKELEDLIAELEETRKSLSKEKETVNALRQEAEALQKKNDETAKKLEARREEILSEAREEAVRLLREAKETADSTIRNIHKYGASGENIKRLEAERKNLHDQIRSHEDKLTALPKKKSSQAPPPKVAIGDRVRVLSMNLTGTVHTLPNEKGELEVQMGILHSTVKLSDLELLPEEKTEWEKKKVSSGGSIRSSKSSRIHTEINLIGKTVDDALAELDKYLDDACLAGLPSVRIVHGKGTGALRKAVHDRLRRLPTISSFRLGEYGEGDAGVTIAEFK